jgi:hypothetical protein
VPLTSSGNILREPDRLKRVSDILRVELRGGNVPMDHWTPSASQPVAQQLSSLCRLYSMRSLGSQNSIRAAPFCVVPQSLGAHREARLLKGSFEQSGMELADHVSGYGAGLPKDAVPGEDLVIISDDVVRTQGSQLTQHRVRGVSRLVHQRRTVASARLSGGFDTLVTACLEALRQKASQAGESTHRIGEIDLLASQAIQVGWLAGFSPALPDRQVSERDQALEMSMRDSSVHAGGFGSIVNSPFGLVQIKIQQDPPAGPILKRAYRAVDLAYVVLAHSASLSTHSAGKGQE